MKIKEAFSELLREKCDLVERLGDLTDMEDTYEKEISHLKEFIAQSRIAEGINRMEHKKIAGDVEHESAEDVAGVILVPGGVGPMTIAVLMKILLRWQRSGTKRGVGRNEY